VIVMATPGVYLLKRNGRKVYVGRSDTNVVRRMLSSAKAARYDLTVTVYETTSARQAYLLECRLFHKHNPCDNLIHPAVPRGMNWRCPDRDCHWA
jgi:hypothetical protein